MKRRQILKASAAAVFIAAGAALCGFVFREPLSRAFVAYIVKSKMEKPLPFQEDGLHAGLFGTGAPMPDIRRAGPSVGIVAGPHFFIVDAGSGSTRNVRLMNFPIGKLDALLLTHFHSDHISDLGEMELQRWSGGNEAPLDVIGPRGVESVVEGFNQAYRQDAAYRVAHHGPLTMPPSGSGGIARPFDLGPESDASAVVFERDGVRITAFKVDHRPVDPAVGYRFDYKGRALVISGDTAYSPSLIEHAKGADVLFCEALNGSMVKAINENASSSSTKKITADIPSYHSTPEEAAKMAQAAGVGRLVFYHIIPPLPSPILRNLFLGDAKKHYTQSIVMGDDGMLISLPANSKTISIKRLF